eukprot:COSAG02_NODE_212_length_28729_cov_45.980196_12_plen_157_part_00
MVAPFFAAESVDRGEDVGVQAGQRAGYDAEDAAERREPPPALPSSPSGAIARQTGREGGRPATITERYSTMESRASQTARAGALPSSPSGAADTQAGRQAGRQTDRQGSLPPPPRETGCAVGASPRIPSFPLLTFFCVCFALSFARWAGWGGCGAD